VLRAVAVILVVYTHTLLELYNSAQAQFHHLRFWGAIGVDLFFIISGFIMTTILPNYVGETDSAKDFIVKRAIRILPLYWLLSSILLFLSRHNPNVLTRNVVIKTYILFPIIDKGSFIFALIPQSWTLAYELYFYFIIFLALVVMKRLANRVVLIALALLIVIGFLFHGGYLATFLTSPLLIEFILGIAIGLAYHSTVKKANDSGKNRLLKNISVPFIIIGAGLMCATIFIGTRPFYMAENIAADNTLAFERALYWGLPCGLLVFGYLFAEYFYRLKASKVLVAIGDASFSCYLVHFIFLRKLEAVLPKIFNINADLYVAVYLVLILVLSFAVYKFIERPLTRACTMLIFKR
jgi:exopolysaccharide production protein ExoZ